MERLFKSLVSNYHFDRFRRLDVTNLAHNGKKMASFVFLCNRHLSGLEI